MYFSPNSLSQSLLRRYLNLSILCAVQNQVPKAIEQLKHGLIAALQVLAVLVSSGKPASEICSKFEALPQVLKNVRFNGGQPLEAASVKKAITDAEEKLNGTGRLLIRKSGTEPLIRVMAEGEDLVLVETVVDGICEAIIQQA